jgi:hypothetical protein
MTSFYFMISLLANIILLKKVIVLAIENWKFKNTRSAFTFNLQGGEKK